MVFRRRPWPLKATLARGVSLGLAAGYAGGFADGLVMRVMDVMLAFPSVLLAIAIAAFLGPNLRNAMLSIAISWWPWYTRIIRGQAVSEAGREPNRPSNW